MSEPIETAPKDGTPVLLWFPELGGWTAGWWRGSWSFAADQWAIQTPFQVDGRNVLATPLPQPTHWQPMPPNRSSESLA